MQTNPENELELLQDDFVELANEGPLQQQVVGREPTAQHLEGLFSDDDDDDEQDDGTRVGHDEESDYEDEEMDSLASLEGAPPVHFPGRRDEKSIYQLLHVQLSGEAK